MSKVLKSVAVILLVLGLIGSYTNSNVLGEFSFTLFLSSFVTVAISAIILFAVGQILDNQEYIINQLRDAQRKPAPEKINTGNWK